MSADTPKQWFPPPQNPRGFTGREALQYTLLYRFWTVSAGKEWFLPDEPPRVSLGKEPSVYTLPYRSRTTNTPKGLFLLTPPLGVCSGGIIPFTPCPTAACS